jgi:hypothetical protein
MNARALFSFAVFGSLLIGCGGGSPKKAAPAVSPLAGNWLIAGPLPSVNFTMDDGSTLGLTGALTDSTESHISALLLVEPSAACGVGPPFFPPTDLTRQN